MLGWLTKRRSAPPPQTLRGSRLSLEPLEPRDVPAANFWLGGDGDFSNGLNWSDGVPTSDDVLHFDGGYSNMGTVFPSSPPAPPPPGGGPSPSAGLEAIYAGIRFQNGYSGTVVFNEAVRFDGYWQDTGYTVQTHTLATVTVTTAFDWTGGVINNGLVSSTLSLQGVAAGQIGTDTTTLQSGSKIVLEKLGTVGTVVSQAGVLQLNNGVGIDVHEDSELDLRRINIGSTGPKILGDGTIYLDQGRLYSSGGEVPAVLIEGGTLEVKPAGLKVTGKVSGSDWGVDISSGLINIKNGTTLEATHGVNVSGGDLTTTAATDGVTIQKATIDGELNFIDGRIVLGTGDGTTYSTLVVTGHTRLFQGVFQTKVDATNGQNRDAIETNDQFDCFTTFKINPQELNGTAVKDTAWSILVSTTGLANGFVDNVDPTLTAAAAPSFTLARNGAKKLDLVRL